ncbi:unnamed protein product [Coccothraustes coccothraustes]
MWRGRDKPSPAAATAGGGQLTPCRRQGLNHEDAAPLTAAPSRSPITFPASQARKEGRSYPLFLRVSPTEDRWSNKNLPKGCSCFPEGHDTSEQALGCSPSCPAEQFLSLLERSSRHFPGDLREFEVTPAVQQMEELIQP